MDSTPNGDGVAEDLDAWVDALLEATEGLRRALASPADLHVAADAWRRRVEAFDALAEAVRRGATPGASARRRLRRLRALDDELLEIGEGAAEAIRDEQVGLRRRRSVIRAHAGRERRPARLVAVKA